MSRPLRDPAALVAGLVVLALGGLLLADRLDGLDLSYGYLLPALCAALGAVLLACGLVGRR